MLPLAKVQSQGAGLADAVSGGGGECRRGADADWGVGPDELGLYDLARQERIRTTNSGSGQRCRFRLPRSSSYAFALGLSRAAPALHPSWRAGVSSPSLRFRFLPRSALPPKTVAAQRRPRARRCKLAGLKQEIEEAGAKLKPFLFSALLSPSGIPARPRTRSPLAVLEILRGRDNPCLTLFLQELFRAEGGSCPRERSRAVENKYRRASKGKPSAQEQGASREADNQAAVLARLLGVPAAKVERALMLFLALLVEVGAALGLFFATGHIRPADLPDARGAGG